MFEISTFGFYKYMYQLQGLIELVKQVNSITDNTILDVTKLKAYDKLNVSQNIIFFYEGRKHCKKRRKFWLPAFSPFSYDVFKRTQFSSRA